jgi:hypothetical protein
MDGERPLIVASLLSLLLTTFHINHDIVVGIERGGLDMAPVLPVLALWAYATLALAGRRSGYAIVFVLSLLASGLPVVHMTGRSGMIGTSARSLGALGAFFFGWTLLALGVSALLSVLLSARGLWLSLRGPARERGSATVASPP